MNKKFVVFWNEHGYMKSQYIFSGRVTETVLDIEKAFIYNKIKLDLFYSKRGPGPYYNIAKRCKVYKI